MSDLTQILLPNYKLSYDDYRKHFRIVNNVQKMVNSDTIDMYIFGHKLHVTY